MAILEPMIEFFSLKREFVCWFLRFVVAGCHMLSVMEDINLGCGLVSSVMAEL